MEFAVSGDGRTRPHSIGIGPSRERYRSVCVDSTESISDVKEIRNIAEVAIASKPAREARIQCCTNLRSAVDCRATPSFHANICCRTPSASLVGASPKADGAANLGQSIFSGSVQQAGPSATMTILSRAPFLPSYAPSCFRCWKSWRMQLETSLCLCGDRARINPRFESFTLLHCSRGSRNKQCCIVSVWTRVKDGLMDIDIIPSDGLVAIMFPMSTVVGPSHVRASCCGSLVSSCAWIKLRTNAQSTKPEPRAQLSKGVPVYTSEQSLSCGAPKKHEAQARDLNRKACRQVSSISVQVQKQPTVSMFSHLRN